MSSGKRCKSLAERRAEVRARHPHLRANKKTAAALSRDAIDERTTLGLDDAGAPVKIDPDSRCEHMAVIGTTGSGKSTLLSNCNIQDITRGSGVIVLDPHGGHPDSLFNKAIPFLHDHRWFDTGKVHIIAPNCREHVVGFNPLAPIADTDPAVIAGALLEAFSRVWGNEDTHSTPMIRRVLLATFIALAEARLPLAEATNLLDYEDRLGLRRELIASVKNDGARRTLEDIHRLSMKPNAIEQFNKTVLGPENRLVDFLACDAIRLMFSTTRENNDRTLDLLEIMNRGDILLVDLQHGKAVDEAGCDLLGKIILRYLFLLMGRRKQLMLPNGEFYHPFFVYIDEAHRYLSGDVPELLTDARKFRVGLTLAHQFLAQLGKPGDIPYNAVRNCTATKVVFRVKSPDEAQNSRAGRVTTELARASAGEHPPHPGRLGDQDAQERNARHAGERRRDAGPSPRPINRRVYHRHPSTVARPRTRHGPHERQRQCDDVRVRLELGYGRGRQLEQQHQLWLRPEQSGHCHADAFEHEHGKRRRRLPFAYRLREFAALEEPQCLRRSKRIGKYKRGGEQRQRVQHVARAHGRRNARDERQPWHEPLARSLRSTASDL